MIFNITNIFTKGSMIKIKKNEEFQTKQNNKKKTHLSKSFCQKGRGSKTHTFYFLFFIFQLSC